MSSINIGILDYGSGNLLAIAEVLKTLGLDYCFIGNSHPSQDFTHLVLPGVGLFDRCISQINLTFGFDRLVSLINSGTVPIMGICVGMQILATSSDEGDLPGLNIIPGTVNKFQTNFPIPHMGWNVASLSDNHNIAGLPTADHYYFIHSYYFSPFDASNILMSTTYGFQFTSAVRKGHVFGYQFHPEKSHLAGLQIFRTFADFKC